MDPASAISGANISPARIDASIMWQRVSLSPRSADDEAPIVTAQPAHPDPPLQAKPVASMKVNEQIDTPSIEKTIQPIPGR
jgi:hypothetical protein